MIVSKLLHQENRFSDFGLECGWYSLTFWIVEYNWASIIMGLGRAYSMGLLLEPRCSCEVESQQRSEWQYPWISEKGRGS